MKKDDKINELLSGTKIKASENLKFRIMHQLEAEQALIPKKKVKSRPVLGSMFSIFGIMYAIIAAIGLGMYFTSGIEALKSPGFYIMVILVSCVCSVFWMISVYDDRRRSKMKMK
ncbi:hypothetical protein [Prevotella sp. 10(H)]|uniref:hypothetical protein n=1 Tax=Prevotella sp. 10(H) TaxID=1158294 RepID=UPI0004A6E929|nr:hypothetical protein [Prevotella sp. 10(H)]